MVRVCSGLMMLLVAGSAGRALATEDDVASLLGKLPASANSLAVVRVDRILRSPRAQQEGWAEKQQGDFLAGAATFPPWVRTFVRASHVHIDEASHGWSRAVVTMNRDIDINETARREGGPVQQISGQPAVLSRRNAYFVQLDQRLMGIVSPAQRQDAFRWIAIPESQPIDATHWLGRVVLEEQADITIAFDARGMFDPILLRQTLATAGAMEKKQKDLTQVHRLLMSTEGLCFTANVAEQTEAQLRIDFASEVPPGYRMVIRGLLLEFLDDVGAALDEFAEARVRAASQSVRLQTTLTDEGLRRVMSLIATPHSMASGGPAVNQPMRVSIPRTREYLKQVDRIIADLEKANRRAKSYVHTATWHDKFAQKIEELSILNVDPDLLDYSATTAARLRALAASLRGVPVQVNLLEKTITWNVYYDPGWATWGWNGRWGIVGRSPSWQATSNVEVVRSRQASAIAKDAGKRQEIWQLIETDRARIRRTLTQKHGVEF